jgi:transposase
MTAVPISMNKLKEILRLKYGAGLKHRQIAASLNISPSVVSTYSNRAAQLGITQWPLPEPWNDKTLQQAFYQTQVKPKKRSLPDWSVVHQELKRKDVTLQLLWEEYAERNPAGFYSYNHYCRLYRDWLVVQKPSMRMSHKAGEKLFVDYCGPTVDIIDPENGEVRNAQVFVAVMGASNYTYAEATWSQGLEDWCMSHARCFDFLGGVPEVVVPDNLKSAVTKAHRYEPDLNPTYQQLAAHYDVAVVPARPYKPKDKAKAEVGVQIVERWIIARLRHETFYSLAQLNQRIAELLIDLNERPMKKHPGSRREQFEQLDKPYLKPLPAHDYEFVHIKTVKVHLDYHVEVDKHYYSVPHSLTRKQLHAHVSGQLVRLYHQGELVASHPRSYRLGGHTTCEQHMPTSHQKMQWSPERFERWAGQIGRATLQLVQHQFQSRRHPEQACRSCFGLLSLAKPYGNERLEAACQRALTAGLYRLQNIQSILKNGLDQQPLSQSQPDLLQQLDHSNLRGQDYYH